MIVCATVLGLMAVTVAIDAYGIETVGQSAAVVTGTASVLAVSAAVVVWERRRERGSRSGRRRR